MVKGCVCVAKGVCMVRGVCGKGGMHIGGDAWWGACVVGGPCVAGGMCGMPPADTTRYGDRVNERAVRILLECILFISEINKPM